MSLRRLHHIQPDSFAFTAANKTWAAGQVAKFPEGRQASAVIPLLWRAQEQESWLSKPAIEAVADMLGMDYIRVLEVATFYFMFQLKPVGTVAHIQVCGTLSCMICGAEDLIGICKDKIAPNAHQISEDGKFSWEEVECLGACTNAPMAQIGKDFYEDLTEETFIQILADFADGKVPIPGPQNGRYAAEPLSGLTSLKDMNTGGYAQNTSVSLATAYGDTIKRIQGDEVPVLTAPKKSAAAKKPVAKKPAAKKTAMKKAAAEKFYAKPPADIDDLKLISGVGPKLEATLNEIGVYQYAQVAAWKKADIKTVDDQLKFKGRIERDDWMAQAKILAKGGETDFSKKKRK